MPNDPAHDYRSMAVEHLGDDNAILRERVASLETDCDVYREVLREALAGWRATLTERDALRRRCAAQHAQMRALVAADSEYRGARARRRRVA